MRLTQAGRGLPTGTGPDCRRRWPCRSRAAGPSAAPPARASSDPRTTLHGSLPLVRSVLSHPRSVLTAPSRGHQCGTACATL